MNLSLKPTIDPFAGMLNEESARALLQLKASPEAQAWAESTAVRCREGLLSDDELRQYESYAEMVDVVSLIQARARQYLKKSGVL